MRLILVPDTTDGVKTGALRYALSTEPLASVILNGSGRLACTVGDDEGLSALAGRGVPENLAWLIPESWRTGGTTDNGQKLLYTGTTGLRERMHREAARYPWLALSNGRYATHVSDEPLQRLLDRTDADAVAITVNPKLLAYREHIRLSQRGGLVGYRRLFRDAAEPLPAPIDWPHHFLVRTDCFDRIFEEGVPTEFSTLVERLRSYRMTMQAVAIAGSVVDMESAEGLLAFSRTILTRWRPMDGFSTVEYGKQTFLRGSRGKVSPHARFIGPVVLGDGVCVESDAVVVGPSILCDSSTVGHGAVLNASILGAGAALDSGQVLRESLAMPSQDGCAVVPSSLGCAGRPAREFLCTPKHGAFRTWPRFSYAGFWKRLVDIVISAVTLVLFAPLIPLIALAIKLDSRGPVFFKDRRQGLHGKSFRCVKFRTMRVGAAEIQDKLRFVSEVDGPQFKMADDPRISTVGRFLRETYLDEIPQFFNVLIGQMSLVGPRPSPESENTLCPWWRDARLSVRPGITGLWQIFRTREPYRDFQEWIYYDTTYVERLSARMDLWLCWCTFRKMVDSFIRQF